MTSNPIFLGVNVDHVATLRQARGVDYPDPVTAAVMALQAGADSITLHLREDRRHIQDADLWKLKQTISAPINLEMGVTEEMLQIAEALKPQKCCFVPEKRAELTTEGGLNVLAQEDWIRQSCRRLWAIGIEVSLFIDPDVAQIEAAKRCGAPVVELTTGPYTEAKQSEQMQSQLVEFQRAVEAAAAIGLVVNAGHGLNYDNVLPIAAIKQIHELNIGHSIIAASVYEGIDRAVKRMKTLIQSKRS